MKKQQRHYKLDVNGNKIKNKCLDCDKVLKRYDYSRCWTCSQKKIKIDNAKRIGDKSFSWKGDNAGYYAMHMWIRKSKVKPILCEICKEKKRLYLSNISGLYKRDINDFWYLCAKCHVGYDWSRRNIPNLRRINKKGEWK